MKPSRDPEMVTPELMKQLGVTMRRVYVRDESGLVGDILLTCDRCGDEWIPRRIGTEYGYLHLIKLGSRLSRQYWVCTLNHCNYQAPKRRRTRKVSMKKIEQERIFKPIPLGRAIELAEIILHDPQEQQIGALLELVAGLTDELGDCQRHSVAASLMQFISGRRSSAWLNEVQRLQSSTIDATA